MSHKVASPPDERLRAAREERAEHHRVHTDMSDAPHWSAGPAKWFAIIVLGLATMGIAGWSLWRRAPSPTLVRGSGNQQSLPLSPSWTGTLPASAAITGLIDLNTADAAVLESLPGIGPALAERILNSRTQLGAFRRVEDLDRVPGIGHKTIEKLRPLVRLSAEPQP